MKIHIDSKEDWIRTGVHTTIDVEDDEKGGFVGIGLSQDGENVYYYTTITNYVKDAVLQHKLAGQNIKYDMHMLNKWGVPVRGHHIANDTYLMAHTIDSIAQNDLKSLADRYLGMKWSRYTDLVTGTGKKKLTLDKHPVEVVADYNAHDVVATHKLADHFLRGMTFEEAQYYQTDLKLQQAIFDMEEKGVRIDVPYLESLKESHEKIVAERRECFDAVGVNPNSPKQLLEHLRKTFPKIKATNEKALKPLKWVASIQKLFSYRSVKKLLSTYIIAPLKQQVNGRLHGKFNLCGTWTGRLSASKPNLQNQPRGPLIRTAFLPEPGELWHKYDYSQLELRMLAHLSQDASLLKAFRDGLDLHTFTASKVFNVRMEEVTPEQRQRAKTVNFGIVYGTTEYGLADQLDLPLEEAEKIIKGWWNAYPGALAYRERVIFGAKRDGYITTLFGIKRKIKGIEGWCTCGSKYCKPCWRTKAMKRELMSAVVSGSSADVVKLAMLQVVEYKPLLQVHDELDFSFPEGHEGVDKVKDIMQDVFKLSVPLVVDHKVGDNWGECK